MPKATEISPSSHAEISSRRWRSVMDAHTHLTFDFTGNFNEVLLNLLRTNVSELGFMAIPKARLTVEAGFEIIAGAARQMGLEIAD